MTLIDEKILEVFAKLLDNPDYFDSVNNDRRSDDGTYLFTINRVKIGLDIFKKSSKGATTNKEISLEHQSNRNWEWDICPHDMEGYTFYLWINHRQYVVPAMSRIEEARALDKLEQLLKVWELGTLNKILNDNSSRF